VPISFLLVPLLLSPVLFDVAFTLLRRALAGERLTAPHRGHLYQVAARAGMRPALVTALYCAMTAWGGVVCLLFVAAPSSLKPFAALLPLPVLGLWTLFVAGRARRAGLARW
jgi:UDP-GlcNAc:undecaprenyl-phosphate GlcNAc-1-phosphate transferase